MRTQAICLTVAIVLHCPFASARWVQTNGPHRGNIKCFAVNGANLFAGTAGSGVFLSTDIGVPWTAVNTGLTNMNVTSLAVLGTNLFAGTEDNGAVFRSTDNGTNWTQNWTLDIVPYDVWALAVSGTNLFAGTFGAGVFLTTDNGRSWTTASNGLTEPYVTSFAASGADLFAGTAFDGVFLSTNAGSTWSQVNYGLTNPTVLALAVSGTNLFAGTQGGVFLSTNSGTNWTVTNIPFSAFSCMVHSGANLFAGTGSGVFRSTDNGMSWTAVNDGLVDTRVSSICVWGSILIAETVCGEFLSTNNGASWRPVSIAGNRDMYINTLAVKGPELFAGATWRRWVGLPKVAPAQPRGMEGEWDLVSSAGCVFRSSDNGESWVPQLASAASTIATQANDVIVGTPAGIYLSTNNGASWTPANAGLADSDVVALAALDSTLFAGVASGAVFLSTNHGTNWAVANTPFSVFSTMVQSGANLFAGTGSGVFRSTDNGMNWTAVNNGLADTTIYSLAFGGTNLFAGTGHGAFRSTDNGMSWTVVNTGLTDPSDPSVTALAVSGTNLFQIATGNVLLSTDNGSRWQSVFSGWEGGRAQAIGINGANVFVGTGDIASAFEAGAWQVGAGVWRRPLSEMITSAQSLSSQVAVAFELQQNYPNPFNPSTTIAYSIPGSREKGVGSTETKLVVFDLLGRQVAVLVHERKTPGSHQVAFDGSGLSSGVYFYRLEAGSFVETKKLVLLR